MGGNENDFEGWDIAQWADPSGTAANNGPQVQGQDILTNSTESQGPDKWTGFFQGILSNVTQYAINKDAARNNLRPVTLPNGQPAYGTATRPGATGGTQYVQGVSNNAAILIGAAIVGVLLVVGGKKA